MASRTSYGTNDRGRLDFFSFAVETWAGEQDNHNGVVEQKCTVVFTALNLAMASLGMGVIVQPYSTLFGEHGVTLTGLFGFACLAFLAGQAIVSAGRRTRKSSYSEIVRAVLGRPAGVVSEVLLSVAVFATAVAYIRELCDFIARNNILGSIALPFVVLALGGLILLLPAAANPSLRIFGWVSFMYIVLSFTKTYIPILVAWKDQSASADTIQTWEFRSFGSALAFSMPSWQTMLVVLPMMFAYHCLLTDSLEELYNPTERRLMLVNLGTVGILFFCFLPLALVQAVANTGTNVTTVPPTATPESQLRFALVSFLVTGVSQLMQVGAYAYLMTALRRRVERRVAGQALRISQRESMASAAGLTVAAVVAAAAAPGAAFLRAAAAFCAAFVTLAVPGALEAHGRLGPHVSTNPAYAVVALPLVAAGCAMAVGSTHVLDLLRFRSAQL